VSGAFDSSRLALGQFLDLTMKPGGVESNLQLEMELLLMNSKNLINYYFIVYFSCQMKDQLLLQMI